MFIKRFLDWIKLKEKLDSHNHSAPHVSEGEIWWASIGENVGSEINGKSNLFSRPVIIFKKLAHEFYFVIPTTTQTRSGSWYTESKPGSGLFGTLEGLSAEEASIPVNGTTIAAQTDHTRYYLWVARSYLNGEEPDKDWEASCSMVVFLYAAW